MKRNEPNDTLSWYAYHEVGEEFHERYKLNQLRSAEFAWLVRNCISHVSRMLRSRSFWDFKMKRYDRNRIKLLKALL